MENYLALFRGINVGGNNLIKMKELVELFEHQGYQKVKNYIQSGNVVFSGTKLDVQDLTVAITKTFGFTPEILFLTQMQFQQAVDNNPYPEHEGKTIHFYFLKNATVQVDTDKLAQLKKDTESYQLIDNVFYLNAPDGVGRSKLAANIEKCLGVPVTARNLNTINKLSNILKAYN